MKDHTADVMHITGCEQGLREKVGYGVLKKYVEMLLLKLFKVMMRLTRIWQSSWRKSSSASVTPERSLCGRRQRQR